MTVLVTGGAGYIGSHVCKTLASYGLTPVVYDNFSEGFLSAVKWGPYVRGDLADFQTLKATLEQFRPLGVIHLASLINVRLSEKNPGSYYQNNVLGTAHLLQAMVETQIARLVFSSSAAVYGVPQMSLILESHPKQPINVYGKTKLICEEMIQDFSHAHGLEFVILRYFNAAGADLEGEIGESHRIETHLIPLTILSALGRVPTLSVYGDDHPTVDGTAVRDYIHVCDLASAHVKALRCIPNLVLNLGTGRGTSVKQVIEAVESKVKRPLPFVMQKRQPSEPSVLVASCEEACRQLGWSPTLSSLDEIVETAWRWHCR